VVLLSIVAASSFAAGAWLAPAAAPWLALPLLLSLACAVFMFRKQERTGAGQFAVTLALTSFALPPMLASGVSVARALAFTGAFASVQALSALTARGAVHRKRDGGRLLAWAMVWGVLAIVTFAALLRFSLWPIS